MSHRVLLIASSSQKNEFGGSTPTQGSNVRCWAAVEKSTGSRSSQADAKRYDYDYKVTVRWRAEFGENTIIDYKGQKLAVKYLKYDRESKPQYTTYYCTTIKQ